MNGLELSERYYEAHGATMLRERFADYSERIAVGLVGDGSECFGFDDEISRDHDWGPGFCVWLAPQDYERIAGNLREAIAKLPKIFSGYGPRSESAWGNGRIGVFEISQFYRGFIGMDHLPVELWEWLGLPENYLAACTNGKVFEDPLHEFTRWRETLLKFYPEDVRLKKIASRCMTIAQFGQYNFERCLKRREYVALQHSLAKFCHDVISLAFLLNKRYCPFFKWMHRALRDLPILGKALHAKMLLLVTDTSNQVKAELMGDICGNLINELQCQGLSDSSSSFLLDHGPLVQAQIKDKQLNQANVWVG